MTDEQFYFSRRKPARCPACGSEKVAKIFYGMPGPDVYSEVESGKIVLGGCCISDFSPSWECRACSTQKYPEKARSWYIGSLETD